MKASHARLLMLLHPRRSNRVKDDRRFMYNRQQSVSSLQPGHRMRNQVKSNSPTEAPANIQTGATRRDPPASVSSVKLFRVCVPGAARRATDESVIFLQCDSSSLSSCVM